MRLNRSAVDPIPRVLEVGLMDGNAMSHYSPGPVVVHKTAAALTKSLVRQRSRQAGLKCDVRA